MMYMVIAAVLKLVSVKLPSCQAKKDLSSSLMMGKDLLSGVLIKKL